ncbi:translation initiation factor IF-3 [Patescibacteria group bacterium]|nr:translation initiation factor IF-3 [Patescibacteria group bacterium]MBU4115755.1 translation initiation factor IF-3 [Patescibacteria group bacterium]
MTKKLQNRINGQIRGEELRIIGPDGSNLGIMKLKDALSKARNSNLDLIEISPTATPPIAKITDYGKFQYEQNKKIKDSRTKSHKTETKTIQIKVGTSGHDLELKAKKVSGWLKEKHRVKIDLFLFGRLKYMEKNFLESRMERILKLITEDFKVSDEIKKSPKGLSLTIEHKQ